MRPATSRIGPSVVLKILSDSSGDELEFLQYLNGIKEPANRTIPLLEVIRLDIGKQLIMLPWRSPLHEVLLFRQCPDDIVSLCAQFIEGVSFLHNHKVAHCDLKPGNIVVDLEQQPAQLFIIDFNLAEFVKSEETMVEGWCGTPPWIAPEVGTQDGPAQWFSPILADRWACGEMIRYFAQYTPSPNRRQDLVALAEPLLHKDPRARPSLSGLKINTTTKRRLEADQEEPLQKQRG
ncbi:kinase-like domain-containing protein [Russula earlei]|uniref:Kinase-like domain-containing protein n=1 Tax=Russula earlei TaxID=71964 RepID=A0ACC0U329_9AGAM|nr:kinase-like domain-containing protein [Russula earlei]